MKLFCSFSGNPKGKGETGLVSYLQQRVPEETDLLKGSDLDTVEYCIQAYFSSKDQDNKYRFVVPLEITLEDVNDLEELYNQIFRLKKGTYQDNGPKLLKQSFVELTFKYEPKSVINR